MEKTVKNETETEKYFTTVITLMYSMHLHLSFAINDLLTYVSCHWMTYMCGIYMWGPLNFLVPPVPALLINALYSSYYGGAAHCSCCCDTAAVTTYNY